MYNNLCPWIIIRLYRKETVILYTSRFRKDGDKTPESTKLYCLQKYKKTVKNSLKNGVDKEKHT